MLLEHGASQLAEDHVREAKRTVFVSLFGGGSSRRIWGLRCASTEVRPYAKAVLAPPGWVLRRGAGFCSSRPRPVLKLVSVRARMQSGRTALVCATMNGHVDVMRQLLGFSSSQAAKSDV